MTPPADKELQKRLIFAWVDDLRTPGLKQGTGKLSTAGGDCCLGRACYVAIDHGVEIKVRPSYVDSDIKLFGKESEQACLPDEAMEVYGLVTDTGAFETDLGEDGELSNVNDTGTAFPEIATLIEDNASRLFINGDEVATWFAERKSTKTN